MGKDALPSVMISYAMQSSKCCALCILIKKVFSETENSPLPLGSGQTVFYSAEIR